MASRPVSRPASRPVVKSRRPGLPGKAPPGGKEAPIDPPTTAIERTVQDYIMAEEIGRGGYGAVFKAWNQRTGELVAIKRLHIRHVEENASSIQTEINLLKKLHHPNIVEYKETIRTADALYIVLEYVENGSLAQTLKKFGSFSETLTAVYISQVLRGLEYLHNQGVIHRDIKGANILTTKTGVVKLADFGVAMSDSEKSNSVVGTPYWMAPEVIEMSGISAACDVWAVGCTVIELLTGKPPYFDLAPMTALFRIVQDDGPPIPESASMFLKDFLGKCFKKVPTFRPSASELLTDPWIDWALKDVVHGNRSEETFTPARPPVPPVIPPPKPPQVPPPLPPPTVSPPAQKLQNPALLAMAKDDEDEDDFGQVSQPVARHDDAKSKTDVSESEFPDELEESTSAEEEKHQTLRVVAQTIRFHQSLMESIRLAGEHRAGSAASSPSQGTVGESKVSSAPSTVTVPEPASKSSAKQVRRPMLKSIAAPAEDDDFGDWDVGGGAGQGPKLQLPGVSTIARSKSVTSQKSDDLAAALGDDDEDWSFAKPASSSRPPLPASQPNQPRPLPAGKPPLLSTEADDEDWGDMDLPVNSAGHAPQPAKPLNKAVYPSNTLAALAMSDEIDSRDVQGLSVGQLRDRISKLQQDTTESLDLFDDDRFVAATAIEEGEVTKAQERQRLAADQERTVHLVDGLLSHTSNNTLLDACNLLLELMINQASLRRYAVSHHAVLTFIDLLIAASQQKVAGKPELYTPKVVEIVLKIINRIILKDSEMKESLSMIGIMPIVVQFASPACVTAVRYQVALFVEEMCDPGEDMSSAVSVQMFLACRGIQLLIQLLRPSDVKPAMDDGPAWEQEYQITLLSLTCVTRLFHFQESIQQKMKSVTKNEIYRLLLRENLLVPLASVLQTSLSMVFKLSRDPSACASPDQLESRQLAISTRLRSASGTMVKSNSRRSLGGGRERVAWGEASMITKPMGVFGHVKTISPESIPSVTSPRSDSDSDGDDDDDDVLPDFRVFNAAPAMTAMVPHTSSAKPSRPPTGPSEGKPKSKSSGAAAMARRASDVSDARKAPTESPIPRSDDGRSPSPHIASELLLNPVDQAELLHINLHICGKVVDILLLLSQGESFVKSQLATHEVVRALVKMLRPTPIDLLWHDAYSQTVVDLLKTIKNMCLEARALKVLEDCGAIAVLIPFLASEGRQVLAPDVVLALYGPSNDPMKSARPYIQSSPAMSALSRPLARYSSAQLAEKAQMTKEVQNAAMYTLFYLCRVNHPRQIIAVEHEIIPVLIKLSGGGVLKQLALPILCELVYASPRTRELLWRVGGVSVYVDILKEAFWQVPALSAVHYWLQQETERVEAVLLMPRSMHALLTLFRSTELVTFSSILQSFIGLPTRSVRLAIAFAKHNDLLKELFRRLQLEEIAESAIVLSQLLKLLSVLLDTRCVDINVVNTLRMREVLDKLCNDQRVLIRELAVAIVHDKLPKA